MSAAKFCFFFLFFFNAILVIAQDNKPDSIPYYVNVENETVVQRSFMFYEGKVLSYCISVGNPEGTHFAFNSFNGSLMLGWHGQFLNAHLMWVHKARGIGVAQPVGVEIKFGNEKAYASSATYKNNWTDSITQPDTIQFLGYDVDKTNRPLFRYLFNGTAIEDDIRLLNQKNIKRTIHLPEGIKEEVFFRLISGGNIKKISSTEYLVDNTISVKVPKKTKVFIQQNDHRDMLVTSLSSDFEYTISW